MRLCVKLLMLLPASGEYNKNKTRKRYCNLHYKRLTWFWFWFFFFQPSKFCFVASIFQEMSKLLPIWETCFLVPIDLNISLCVKFSAELGWHHNHNFTITSISTSTRIRCTLKKIQSSILPSYSHLIKLMPSLSLFR